MGAGPVGLTVGIELFRRGVPCRVIDRLVEAPQYAKAMGIQPRTLEVWLLTHRVHRLGGHIERGVELVGFESDSNGVNARLLAADGEQEL